VASTLINERTGAAVATAVEVAETRASRRQGLLGRNTLAPSAGLMLTPCMAVHTAFMRFAIDVIFVDREGRAVQIVADLRPWRAAASMWARAVIELPGGTAAARGIRLGDRLFLAPPPVADAPFPAAPQPPC
jgi:uncharacterized protein